VSENFDNGESNSENTKQQKNRAEGTGDNWDNEDSNSKSNKQQNKREGTGLDNLIYSTGIIVFNFTFIHNKV